MRCKGKRFEAKRFTRVRLAICAGLLAALSGCDDPEPQLAVAPVATNAATAEHSDDVIATTAFIAFTPALAYAQLSDATQAAKALNDAIQTLLTTPNEKTLEAARLQWQATYSTYLKSVVFSYLPIKSPKEWRKQHITYRDLVFLIDPWPIEGGYVDYVEQHPFSGIVNDLTLEINADTVFNQHGLSDPSSASLGFQVLAFLLWGEQGQRQASDFDNHTNTAAVVGDDTQKTQPAVVSVQNNPRRRALIKHVSDRLHHDLNHLKQRWQTSGHYAQALVIMPPMQALSGAFIAAERLLQRELLQRRFAIASSPFSRSERADRTAVLDGLALWLLHQTDLPQGKHEGQLPAPSQQPELIGELATSIDQARQCFVAWHGGKQAESDCHQALIRVLSTLHKLSRALGIEPRPERT